MNELSLESRTVKNRNGVVLFRVTYHDGDATVEKTLSLEDYIYILQNGSAPVEKNTWQMLTNLPSNCYAVATSGIESTFRGVFFVPGEMRGVSYEGGFIYRVPYPNLVFFIEVKDGKMSNSRCYAVKDNQLSPQTELFQYPFGNVREDGGICWGNVDRTCGSILQVPELLERFFEAGTSSHYYKPGKTITKKLSLCKQYESLQNKEVYPASYLAPLQKTLDSLTELLRK